MAATQPCARDIMATNLVTLSPHMDVFDAITLLLKHRISGAPVIERDGTFLGVFSEKNCMSLLVKCAYEQLPSNEVSAFIDEVPRTIEEETDLLTIAQIFSDTNARRLPVVRDGKVTGQVSRRDVMRAAHEMMSVASTRDSALLYLSSLVDRNEAPIEA